MQNKIAPYKTSQEVSALFGISETRVWQLKAEGKLNGELIGHSRIIWIDEKYEQLKKERGISHE